MEDQYLNAEEQYLQVAELVLRGIVKVTGVMFVRNHYVWLKGTGKYIPDLKYDITNTCVEI